MKILITGVGGFCGSFLSSHFTKKDERVIGLDIEPNPELVNLDNFQYIRCDVREKVALFRIFQEHRPDCVIHLAYLLDPVHDRALEYDVDVGGTKNVLEEANETPSVRQFILMSSASVYGAHPDNPEWLDEDAPLRPAGYNYAVYKREGERFCRTFERRGDMNLVILRMCVAVGPSYRKPGGTVATLANSILIPDIPGGDGRIQLIHEHDAAELVDRIVRDEKIAGTFNLCSDSFSTIRELGRECGRTFVPMPLGLLKVLFGAMWHLRLAGLTPAMAPLLAHGIVASPKKLMERYGYTFRYSTREAFLDTVRRRRAMGTL
ncbi:MAG: NAD-dependent epimerase/dehydratase family protein [Pseudomonadota bacterium]